MDDMGKNRPLYLQRHTTRHGLTVWYVRVKRGPLIRIKAEYGTDEFNALYMAAISGQPIPKPKANSASLQWLYDRYRESQKWSALSLATRRQRQNILGRVMAKSGHEPFKAIDSSDIEAAIDGRRDTPAQARNYLDAMTGMFRWAKKNGHVDTDPTAGVERPRRLRDSEGHPVWNEADLAAYRERWPTGTRQRVWMEVLLWTGLRRGDAVRVGKMHIKGGSLTIATEKTGMVVNVLILPPLVAALKAGPTGAFTFICGERGEKLTKETFGNFFKAACRDAGLEKRSAHGLRKLAATMRVEAGYTTMELEADFGWTGGYMASLYTRSADRKRLSEGAAQKLMVLPDIQRVLPGKSDSDCKGLEASNKPLVRSRRLP